MTSIVPVTPDEMTIAWQSQFKIDELEMHSKNPYGLRQTKYAVHTYSNDCENDLPNNEILEQIPFGNINYNGQLNSSEIIALLLIYIHV